MLVKVQPQLSESQTKGLSPWKRQKLHLVITHASCPEDKPWAHRRRAPWLLTRVTPQVDLQATGFVVLFAAPGKGAGEELLFPEVGSVMGEQGAHRDEGLLTA